MNKQNEKYVWTLQDALKRQKDLGEEIEVRLDNAQNNEVLAYGVMFLFLFIKTFNKFPFSILVPRH